MNANNATTNAQTMNAYTPRVMIMTFGRHTSTVNYTDIKKVRAYMKKKATQGFTIDSVYGMGTEAVLITLIKDNHVSYTPGFQLVRIHPDHIYCYGTKNACKNWNAQIAIPEPTPTIDHYRVRTVVKGVIVDSTNEPTELDARTTAQQIVDADPTGTTEAWIIPVMSDRTLNGVLDVIRYIDPSEDTDSMFPDDEPTPTVSVDVPIESASIQTTNTSATMGPIDHDEIRAIMDARAVWLQMTDGTEWMIGLWNWECEHFSTGEFSHAYDMETFTLTSKGMYLGVGRDRPIFIKWSSIAHIDVIPMTFKGVN